MMKGMKWTVETWEAPGVSSARAGFNMAYRNSFTSNDYDKMTATERLGCGAGNVLDRLSGEVHG